MGIITVIAHIAVACVFVAIAVAVVQVVFLAAATAFSAMTAEADEAE